MKSIKILPLFLLFLLFISCGKDDESKSPLVTCEQEDWVGTYNGRLEQSEGFPEYGITRIVSQGSNADEFIYEGKTVNFIDCEAEISYFNTFVDAESNVVFRLIDGDSIFVRETVTPPTLNYSINWTFVGRK